MVSEVEAANVMLTPLFLALNSPNLFNFAHLVADL